MDLDVTVERGVQSITLEIGPEKYEKEFNDALKKISKKTRVPGFRPGCVPYSILKKKFGRETLFNILTEKSEKELNAYLTSNQVKFLFSPILKETNISELDPENNQIFFFKYEIALFPEFPIIWPKGVEFSFEEKPVTEEMVDNFIKNLQKENGELKIVDCIEQDDDYIFATFEGQGYSKNPEVLTKKIFFRLGRVESEDAQNLLHGKKTQEKLKLHPLNIYSDPQNAQTAFDIPSEWLSDDSVDWTLRIDEIKRVIPSELNEDLYLKSTGNPNIKTEDEFRAYIREVISGTNKAKARINLINEIRQWFFDNYRNVISLPDEFIKRWLTSKSNISENPGKMPEMTDEEFEKRKEGIRWQIILTKLEEELEIDVTSEELNEELNQVLLNRLRRLGFNGIPDSGMMERLKSKVLSDENEMYRLHKMIVERKLMNYLVEKFVPQAV